MTIRTSIIAMKAPPPPPPAAASTGNLVSVETSSVPGGCTVLLISGTLNVSVVDCACDELGVSTGNVVSVPRMTSVRAMKSEVCVGEDGDCPKELVKI